MIEIIDLSKEYQDEGEIVLAIDGISLRVARGIRIGVLGRKESGKSTLIRLVGGIEKPTRGQVRRSMSVSWPLASRGGFHPALSGYSNLRFIARIYNQPYEQILDYVEAFTELGACLKDPVRTYSASMKAKLAFGVALAIEFDCYLVDEIIGVGDHEFRKKCRTELFEKRRDRALLIVSQQTATLQQSCDFAILMDRGRHVDTFDIAADKKWKQYVSSD